MPRWRNAGCGPSSTFRFHHDDFLDRYREVLLLNVHKQLASHFGSRQFESQWRHVGTNDLNFQVMYTFVKVSCIIIFF